MTGRRLTCPSNQTKTILSSSSRRRRTRGKWRWHYDVQFNLESGFFTHPSDVSVPVGSCFPQLDGWCPSIPCATKHRPGVGALDRCSDRSDAANLAAATRKAPIQIEVFFVFDLG